MAQSLPTSPPLGGLSKAEGVEKTRCHDFPAHSPRVKPYSLESVGKTSGLVVPSTHEIKAGETRISPLNTANVDVLGCLSVSCSPHCLQSSCRYIKGN